ncbi:MAG: hypothetical protein AB8G15_02830 [Saprospiraceae bacterium]
MAKIKTYKTYTTNEATEGESRLTYLEERNNEEIVILKESYHLDGELKSKMERTLDEKGRVLEEIQYSELSEEPDQIAHYRYNDSNQLAVIETSYRDNSKSIRKYEYNKEENSLTVYVRDENDELEGKEYRKFDEEGRVIHEEIYGAEEVFMSHMETKYDEYDNYLERYFEYPDDFVREYFYKYLRNDKAQIVKIQIVDNGGKLAREDFMDYDERGNRIIHRFSDFEQNLAETRKYEFDENDREVKEQHYGPDESLKQNIDYTYREDGLLAEEHHFSITGEVTLRFEYEFFHEVDKA